MSPPEDDYLLIRARHDLIAELESIIISEISFDDTTLAEAVTILNNQASILSEKKVDPLIRLDYSEVPAEMINQFKNTTITFGPFYNVSLYQVVIFVVKHSGCSFWIGTESVLIRPILPILLESFRNR